MSDRQHKQPLVDAGTAVLASGAFLAGILIGASGPLFVLTIVVALAGGPTWGGLALLGAILLGAISTVIVIVALAAGHRPYLGVATVVACAALISRILPGSSFGSSRRLEGWAATYASPAATSAWVMPSYPTYLQVHAETIELDAASGFVKDPTSGGPDGTFGHSCRSGPDSTVVAEDSAPGVAQSAVSTIHADLYLRDPALIGHEPSGTYPRLALQLGGPSGTTDYRWTGPAHVVSLDGPAGTVLFDARAAGPAPPGLPPVLSGQVSWSCRAWSTP